MYFPLFPAAVDQWVEFLISWVALLYGVYAFGHAVAQQSDAYTATGKQTKGRWLAFTGGGAFVCLVFPMFPLIPWFPFGSNIFIFWIAGVVAIMVYLVDVKPRLVEVQRGSK